MTSMVETVAVADIPDIAAYFSSQKRKGVSAGKLKSGDGEQIYLAGVNSRALPACASCHGVKGRGNLLTKAPALAGQHREYIAKALRDFRDGVRSNDHKKVMRDVASKLTDKQIESLAIYIEVLGNI